MSSKKKPTKKQPVKKPVAVEEPTVPQDEASTPVEPESPVVEDEPEVEPSTQPVQEIVPTEPEENPTETVSVTRQPFTAAVRDPRLPPVGATITRRYKGTPIEVTVLETGFEFEGKTYSSISKVAQAVTGHKAINGFAFFKLGVTPGGKGHSGAGLQGKISKLERLTAKMRAALTEGGLALADAEKELEEIKGKAGEVSRQQGE